MSFGQCAERYMNSRSNQHWIIAAITAMIQCFLKREFTGRFGQCAGRYVNLRSNQHWIIAAITAMIQCFFKREFTGLLASVLNDT